MISLAFKNTAEILSTKASVKRKDKSYVKED